MIIGISCYIAVLSWLLGFSCSISCSIMIFLPTIPASASRKKLPTPWLKPRAATSPTAPQFPRPAREVRRAGKAWRGWRRGRRWCGGKYPDGSGQLRFLVKHGWPGEVVFQVVKFELLKKRTKSWVFFGGDLFNLFHFFHRSNFQAPDGGGGVDLMVADKGAIRYPQRNSWILMCGKMISVGPLKFRPSLHFLEFWVFFSSTVILLALKPDLLM